MFKNILSLLLELRILLPPVYNFDPRYFVVNSETKEVKIIVSEVLFERENTFLPVDMNKKDLVYKSPEELFGKERQLTTPFWVVGVAMFQLQYGRHPFETHLKPRVMEHLIKKYPVVFPDELNDSPSSVSPDLVNVIAVIPKVNPAQTEPEPGHRLQSMPINQGSDRRTLSSETEPDRSPDLKSLLTDLLTKDSDQRIGSDKCEMEILQHAYFEE